MSLATRAAIIVNDDDDEQSETECPQSMDGLNQKILLSII